MNFAREGLVYVAIAAALSGLAFVAAVMRRSWSLWLLAIALLVATLWVAYFFRAPERGAAHGDRLVLSPAPRSGRVRRASLLMTVFHVHVNRHSVGGTGRHLLGASSRLPISACAS